MALRLSLVIDGDASRATSALKTTASEVQKLDTATTGLARASGTTVAKLDETGAAAGRAGLKIRELKGTFNELITGGTSLQGFLKGAVAGLVGGLAVGAVTQAFATATGAAIDFFREIVTGEKQAKEQLESHRKLVADIASAYGIAETAAGRYAGLSTGLLQARLRMDAREAAEALKGELAGIDASIGNVGFDINMPFRAQTEGLRALAAQIAQFRQDAAAGAADVGQFQTGIAGLLNAHPDDVALERFGKSLLEITQRAAALSGQIAEDKALQAALGLPGSGGTFRPEKPGRFFSAFEGFSKGGGGKDDDGFVSPFAFDIRPVKAYGDALSGVKEIADSLFSGLGSQLVRTGDLWGALGDRAVSAIGRIADRALDTGLNVLWNGLGSLFGGGLKGGLGIGSGIYAGLPSVYAAGGPVRGPGTGTSDSILARVSAGEYIVNAASAARHRALLDAVNDNRTIPGFAAGGPVGGGAARWGAPVINIVHAPGTNSTTRENADGSVDVLVELIESRIDAFSRNRLPDRVNTIARNPRRR